MKRSIQNKKIIKEVLTTFKKEVMPTSDKRIYINKIPELKEIEMIQLAITDLSQNNESGTGLLSKFNKFIQSYKIDKLYEKYAKDLKPEDLALLKAYFGELKSSQKAPPEKLFTLLKKISAEIENDFLKSLSSGQDISGLKKQLDFERNEILKNTKPEKISALTKMCFAAIGTSMTIHGHLAAIGPTKTVFDNFEDQWLRDNRYNFGLLAAVAITPTCFGKIPLYISERLNIGKIGIAKLNDQDFRLIENSLERAEERYNNGERIKSKTLTKSTEEVISKVESYFLYEPSKKEKILLEAPNLLIQTIDDLSGGERKLQSRMTKDLGQNDTKLLKELLNSKDPRFFETLLEYLQNGDQKLAAEFIDRLDANRFDLIKYLSALKDQYINSPETLSKIERNLESIKSEMKIKNIPLPDAKACLIALGTYIGTRDLFFSIKNSYIEDELNYLWEDVMYAGDALTGLGIAYFCLSDLMIHGGDLGRYFQKVTRLNKSKENITQLIDNLKQLRSDKILQSKIGRLKYIPSLDNIKTNELAKKIHLKFSQENHIDPNSKLNKLWSEYLKSKRVNFLFKDYSKKLTSKQKIELEKLMNGDSLSLSANVEKALFELDEFNKSLADSFKTWVKTNHLDDSKEVLKLIDELEIEQEDVLKNLKKPNLGTNACFWGVGTILAGLGYHAAVGNKASELDHKLEVKQREETDLLFKSAQAIFLGTCGANVIFSGIAKNKKIKFKRENPFLSNSKNDWQTLREVLESSEGGDSGANTNKLALKDMIKSVANTIGRYHGVIRPNRVNTHQTQLEKTVKSNIELNKKLNFDLDCLNHNLLNFLK